MWLWTLLFQFCCLFLVLGALALALLWIFLTWKLRQAASESPLKRKLEGKETLGFFHPYCAAGGGGERVLWCAIDATQREHPGLHCVVYTGDNSVTPEDMLKQAESRFGVKLCPKSIDFAYLASRHLVEPSVWPRFTLLGQSLGSMRLAWEAICKFCPDIMVDTMGYAFTYPIFAYLGRCRTGCYVHYPTVSTDMLESVRAGAVTTFNKPLVAKSRLLSHVKLVYYQLFARLYGRVGRRAEVVLVNSSWTRGHIDQLWQVPHRTSTVFPPCDTTALAALPLEREPSVETFGGHIVLSLAQFRPEKDHAKQLYAFKKFLDGSPERRASSADSDVKPARLIMAGGCRDEGDWGRFRKLKALCTELGLRARCSEDIGNEDWDVDLRANLPLSEVQKLLGQATVGLHTMRDEHFGISVVEFMAAGAVVLAHNSAGPAMDIVRPARCPNAGSSPAGVVGFLASDEAEYAEALKTIFALTSQERKDIGAAARQATSDRFSQESFENAFASRMIAALRKAS